MASKKRASTPRTRLSKTGSLMRKATKQAIVPYVSQHLKKIDYKYTDVTDEFRPWISEKYEPQMVDYVLANAYKGWFLTDYCAAFGICDDTLYAWRDKYPEFALALKTAKEQSEKYYFNLARDFATGDNQVGDLNAIKWLMAVGHGRSEKNESKIEVSGAVAMTVSAAQIIAQCDDARKIEHKEVSDGK